MYSKPSTACTRAGYSQVIEIDVLGITIFQRVVGQEQIVDALSQNAGVDVLDITHCIGGA
jgi:hypothetical protein